MPMRSKLKILSSFLLIILIVGMLCACGSPAPSEEEPPNSDMPSTPADRVEVVYFYRPHRCYSCVYAETCTIYTLETYFADELASGEITWASYDVTAEENAAIVEKYGAYTSSLFINTIIDGVDHIEMVNEIWFVIGDDEAFIEVVRSKIEQSLSGEG